MNLVPLVVGMSLVALAAAQGTLAVNRVQSRFLHDFSANSLNTRQVHAIPVQIQRVQSQVQHRPTNTVVQAQLYRQPVTRVNYIRQPATTLLTRSLVQPSLQSRQHIPVHVERRADTEVLTIAPDGYNQFKLMQRIEPPQIQQVVIRDPQITVIEVRGHPQPPQRIFTVKREPDPPAMIEFVNEGPANTHITYLDDTESTEVQQGVQAVDPRHRPPPVRRYSRDATSRRAL